jgi:DNA polymerase-3 subunit delta'
MAVVTVVERSTAPPPERVLALLPGIDAHPHARAVLGPALPPRGSASHAYLFHGPAGTGKRAIARAFAAALLADGAADPDAVAARVARGAHPDLTWVVPSGASEMLVSDIEEPVVAAAARTPFEAARRVFVIEAVDTMNDQAANRMLKTLEEPPPFAHLLLLTERREDVLATIASRCQLVRFDPLSPERIAGRVEQRTGVDAARALACARLAQGDASLAARLAGDEGDALRRGAERYARCALADELAERPWLGMLDAARAAGAAVAERAQDSLAAELELLPSRERKRHERESLDARRRGERRARMHTLDLCLRLVELWLRDVLCICEGAPELILASDRAQQLGDDAAGRRPGPLRSAIALAGDARLSLSLNVAEELALEVLAYRLASVLGGA